jgi:ATP-dependent helicase HepA
MNKYVIGQRYMSLAEPELGLGIIQHVEDKMLKVIFPSSEESRQYGIKTAPLKRIIFEVGDEITLSTAEVLKIDNVQIDELGIIYYSEKDITVSETELSNSISFHHPEEKLLNGLSDHSSLFQLRQKTFQYKSWLEKSPYSGFLGSRVALIDHQLYLADKVTSRLRPRVLLADEVGLGKTIESGLIINKLLMNNRASRVLIVTPNTLNYQWFVEMLRKYNLTFSVVNEQTELEVGTNPFDQNNLVITSMQLLCGSEVANEMSSSANWDLLVVDEAHKLFWKDGKPSTQYSVIENLAAKIPGLILLTATPEIYGLEGHFSHLRLIDPERFNDYEQYIQEQNQFADHAKKAKELIENQGKSHDDPDILSMIDRHGPGRVYFRNTRELIDKHHRYFPERCLKSYEIENTKTLTRSDEYSKKFYQMKLHWLINYLEENPRKTLLICHSKETVTKIEKDLKRLTVGNVPGVFHEELSLMARDRQAAYFRDEEGSNILLCSEIGSEGRNFQFCQDMILFDLPLNPDLLEQRIGRLDRIGQKDSINIHVPIISNSWEETLFHWYDKVFNSFRESVKGAGLICERYKDELHQTLDTNSSEQELFAKAKEDFLALTKKQEEGRNILLEINSFNREKAEQIVKDIRHIDRSEDLKVFLEDVYNYFGVDVEDIAFNSQFIKPGDNMFIPHFPFLPESGFSYTFDRQTALEREELQFMSWDHPMVRGIIDLITGEEFGNVTVMTRKNGQVKNFLELFYNLQSTAPKSLQINRFLPATPVRVLIDVKGNDFSEKWSKELLDDKLIDADNTIKNKILTIPKSKIKELMSIGKNIGEKQKEEVLNKALNEAEAFYSQEIARLKELKEINNTITELDIDLLKQRKEQIIDSIRTTNFALDSFRFIF